jgi:hypothetical protein
MNEQTTETDQKIIDFLVSFPKAESLHDAIHALDGSGTVPMPLDELEKRINTLVDRGLVHHEQTVWRQREPKNPSVIWKTGPLPPTSTTK